MYRIIIVHLFAILMLPLQGQDAGTPVIIDAGYFGETLTRAGAIVAVQKAVSKKNDLHHLRLNVAYYRHWGYNNNLVILPEYVFRKTGVNGLFFEASGGGGWMYQVPDRPVILYEEGVFSETRKGWSYVAPTIQIGGGKKILQGTLEGFAFSAGLRWFGQYPFNDFLMHHLALEGRISVPLGVFK